MRRAVVAQLALMVLAASACSDERATRSAEPAPHFTPVRLTAPLPGPRAEGRFRDERGRPLADVHRLAVATDGDRRAVLVVGRRDGRPCVGATVAGASGGTLDCFESWENPPLVPLVVVGGDSRRRTDWLAVLGLARSPTASVVLDSQSQRGTPVPLRSWPRFPWRSFAVLTRRGDLGNMLAARDRDGAAVVLVELSWSYNPPCLQDNHDVCGAVPPPGSWSEPRDPVADASGADESAYPLVFAHPAVRRLAAGRRFFVNPAQGWERCDGSELGSVVSLRIWPPVSYEGEIPLHEYAREGEDVAYREGRAYVEADRVTSIEVWVDRRRKRVVGIDLDAFDATESLEEQSKVEIETWDVTDAPEPAGGKDDAGQCPSTSSATETAFG